METVLTTGDATITLRPAHAGDEAFLHELYADRRGPELAALGWAAGEVRRFVDMQFQAQQQGYGAAFPDADHRIVLDGTVPVGRLLVDRHPDGYRIVDVVVLTRARGRGIGTALVRAVLAAAATDGVPVRIRASLLEPRLVPWYERLGFRVVERGDLDASMVAGG